MTEGTLKITLMTGLRLRRMKTVAVRFDKNLSERLGEITKQNSRHSRDDEIYQTIFEKHLPDSAGWYAAILPSSS